MLPVVVIVDGPAPIRGRTPLIRVVLDFPEDKGLQLITVQNGAVGGSNSARGPSERFSVGRLLSDSARAAPAA